MKLTIPGRPPRKNMHKRVAVINGKPRPYTTQHAKDFFKRLESAYTNHLIDIGWMKLPRGALSISIDSYHDILCHLDGIEGNVRMDVDAPISLILDGLQKAGVVDDDVRFVELVARKHYDKLNPRVEIEMKEIVQ